MVSEKNKLPLAVVMISLNEGHNMECVLKNISGWAQEIFLVDSFSQDDTIDIALKYGVNVVQRAFNGFGDQWNFALNNLPITSSWVMKLDPDEIITDRLKESIELLILQNNCNGINVERRLWFMGTVLPISQVILRLWRNGSCKFTDVEVNEHPLVSGKIVLANGYLEHHDSPNLDHWIVKQNKYTTTEAINQYQNGKLAVSAKLFGSKLERRMWIKKIFWKIPGRYSLLFAYHYIFLGAWKSGKIGWIWSHLRVEVYRYWGYKKIEMDITGKVIKRIPAESGKWDERVKLYK